MLPNPYLFIQGQYGLGDNILARPFIRAATGRNRVVLATSWPELYEDLPLQFAKVTTKLRTQAKNVAAQDDTRQWWPHEFVPLVKVAYGHQSLKIFGSITKAIERRLPLRGEPYVFDLPDMGLVDCLEDAGRPLAFVRPVTSRREWLNTARNPRPEYVNAIAGALMETHHVVCVADLQDGEEWLEGELPPHHTAFLRGELRVRQMLALLRASAVAVGGVGWLVPASIALRVPAFIVLGGQGQHNAPSVITDPRQDLSNIAFAKPLEYCQCSNMRHDCAKTIPNLAEQWNLFASARPSLPSLPTNG